MVSIPLHHFTSVIKVLGMIVGSTDTVLIHVSKLHFDPCRVEPLLMQNSTHDVPEAVAGSLASITDAFDHHVDTGLTHRFVDIAAPWRYQLVLTSVGTEFLQDRQNLI